MTRFGKELEKKGFQIRLTESDFACMGDVYVESIVIDAENARYSIYHNVMPWHFIFDRKMEEHEDPAFLDDHDIYWNTQMYQNWKHLAEQ